MYLITAPKRGNTAANNEGIVTEITVKRLYKALFKVDVDVDTTENSFILKSPIKAVVEDATDNSLARINGVNTETVSVTA